MVEANLISVQSTGRTRSSSLVTITQPPVSSSLQITNRSFTYASPYLWNQLPFYTRQHICYSAYVYVIARPSVCLSVPLDFREQVSSRNSKGFPRAAALNEGGVSKIGNFRNLSHHISPKRCKIGLKLLLITNRNMYTRFPLVPKWPWVTADPAFKVTVGKIGDFWPLSCQYLKNGWR